MEEKQQTLPGDAFVGCEKDTPTQTYKYLEVEVTRQEGTWVYLKIPSDFDINKIRRGHGPNSILVKACKETTADYDWDNAGWEHDVECQSFKEVPEKEALRYEVYDVENHDKKKS